MRLCWTWHRLPTGLEPQLAAHSQQHQTHIPRLRIAGRPPVVQVQVQPAVTDAKFELLQEASVLKHIQRVENVVLPAPALLRQQAHA